MANISFEARRGGYAQLWASMEVRASKAADIDATAQKIADKKTRYSAVAEATGVPWYVIGLIHAMEAGCNFACHLHNGDSLQARTHQVPAGRPREGEPPFQWKDSAIDAIRYDGLDKVEGWSIERICYELEKFNGWGYVKHHPDVNSPYLWSGSNQYSRGKYVADGQWSSSAVSGQSGALPILKRIMELDAEVRPALATEAPEPVEEKIVDPSVAFRKAVPEGAIAGAAAAVAVPNPAETVLAADAPVQNDAGKTGFWDRFAFTKINELVDLGSRVGGSIRAGGNWVRGLFVGTTVVGGGTVALIDPTRGTAQVATKTLSPYPILFVAVVAFMLGVTIVSGLAWLYFHRAGRGLVSAADAKRYSPRGANQ